MNIMDIVLKSIIFKKHVEEIHSIKNEITKTSLTASAHLTKNVKKQEDIVYKIAQVLGDTKK